MKRSHRVLLASALAMAACAASASGADQISLNHFNRPYLPVLVQVDSSGKVTSVSAAEKLKPALARLLRENLSQMITGPAHEHGKPVASQLVMNMAVQATPTAHGKYQAHFVYLSSSPVPPGSWYWEHIDGVRLALVNRNGFRDERPQFRPPSNEYQRNDNSNRFRQPPPPSPPPAQHSGSNAPAPAPPAGKGG